MVFSSFVAPPMSWDEPGYHTLPVIDNGSHDVPPIAPEVETLQDRSRTESLPKWVLWAAVALVVVAVVRRA